MCTIKRSHFFSQMKTNRLMLKLLITEQEIRRCVCEDVFIAKGMGLGEAH